MSTFGDDHEGLAFPHFTVLWINEMRWGIYEEGDIPGKLLRTSHLPMGLTGVVSQG